MLAVNECSDEGLRNCTYLCVKLGSLAYEHLSLMVFQLEKTLWKRICVFHNVGGHWGGMGENRRPVW